MGSSCTANKRSCASWQDRQRSITSGEVVFDVQSVQQVMCTSVQRKTSDGEAIYVEWQTVMIRSLKITMMCIFKSPFCMLQITEHISVSRHSWLVPTAVEVCRRINRYSDCWQMIIVSFRHFSSCFDVHEWRPGSDDFEISDSGGVWHKTLGMANCSCQIYSMIWSLLIQLVNRNF